MVGTKKKNRQFSNFLVTELIKNCIGKIKHVETILRSEEGNKEE
jgi:hypothetical protein